MMRAHSVTATVKQILQATRLRDVIRVGIVGEMGSGKSTFAITIAHLAHKHAGIPFTVRVFDKNALLDFEQVMKSLEPANYIIIIDDASFLSAQASKQKMDVIKQDITEVRHFDNLKGKKIIFIINWHYEYGLDKFIRSTEFRYCTGVGSSDTDNFAKLVGIRYLPIIGAFQSICATAIATEKFSFRLGKGNVFTYDYRKPFIPLLFYNKKSLIYIVSPKRQFIDPICHTCSNAENNGIEAEIDEKEALDKLSCNIGDRRYVAKLAMRLKLFQNGINVFPRSVTIALRKIDELYRGKEMNFEKMAEYLRLDKETRGKPPLDSVEPISFIEPIQTTEPKNKYLEYDTWNYESIVAEIEKMLQMPLQDSNIPKYEYLNEKARGLIEIANSSNPQ